MLDVSNSQTQEHGRTPSCNDVVAAAPSSPRRRTCSTAPPLLQVRARIRSQAAAASPHPYPFGPLSRYRNTAPTLAARTRCCSSLMSRPPGPRVVTRLSHMHKNTGPRVFRVQTHTHTSHTHTHTHIHILDLMLTSRVLSAIAPLRLCVSK